MSARSHVDVKERRLRPIYDCLDNGNNKKAVQEADKVLRKQDDLLCAKALKSLALLRLGRHDDSSTLLSDVHQSSPVDDSTLQAMALCYREMHRLDLIADMYDRANQAKPNSEEILTALFMAHVRLGDYKKQQQVAMQLHRLRPNKNPYYFWAIMSIYMQARNADQKVARAVFLPLAERMARKYVDEDKIEAEAELRMFLIILELQDKKHEALELIQGDLAKRYCSELNFNRTKTAELLEELKMWSQMNAVFRKLIIAEPDQWNYFKKYLTSAFQLVKDGWQPVKKEAVKDEEEDEDVVDHTFERVAAFLLGNPQKEAEKGKAEKPLRSAYLARLEFILLLNEGNYEHSEDYWGLGKVSDLIREYYATFGDKSCCFADLKSYIRTLLTEEQQTEILNSFLTELNMQPTDGEIVFADDGRNLLRHLNILQWQHYLGRFNRSSRADKEILIEELKQRHMNGLQFGKELLTTDFQPSDPYLLMATHLLCEIWQENDDQCVCWQAIALLETGLVHSPSNFHFKLLLIRLFTALGAFGPCRPLYESMDIKHVQNDSLGYVIANHIGRLGHLSSAGMLYDAMLEFFTLNHKDTAEYMISAYKFGAFHKINEFLGFKNRLQNSVQCSSATIERLLLDIAKETKSHQKTEQILHYMEIDPLNDKMVWEDLRDNRDFDIWLHWQAPDRELTPVHIAESFEEEKAWLRVRHLLVRMLAAIIQLGSNSEHDGSNNNHDKTESKQSLVVILKDLMAQFSQHLESCSRDYAQPTEFPLLGPYRTRLSTYLRLNLGSFVLDALDTALYVQQVCQNGTGGKVDEKRETTLKSALSERLSSLVKSQQRTLLVPQSNSLDPTVLEEMVLISECVGQLVIVAGASHRFLKPLKTMLTKKKKKKKQSAELPVTFSTFAEHLTNLQRSIEQLKDAVKTMDGADIVQQMAALQLNEAKQPESVTEVWRKIQGSYEQSSQEMLNHLALKVDYLQSLKL